MMALVLWTLKPALSLVVNHFIPRMNNDVVVFIFELETFQIKAT